MNLENIKERDYYSIRTGKSKPDKEVDLKVLKKLFIVTYDKLYAEGYFQKYFGYYCVDAQEVAGELGDDLASVFFIHLKKDNIYPIHNWIELYKEDDLFDLIEFLHDFCSQPIDGYYHSWNECGYHYEVFDDKEGQKYFREAINTVFKKSNHKYELSENGEILQLADKGLSYLFDADIPTDDKENIEIKVEKAIQKFRRYKSTLDDRQDAIRDLVDVLEFLRPQAKQFLQRKDESDLFNIANNYGIRHHNENQKNNYDKPIWMSWMFYHYLATIHALLRIINKNKSK